MTVTQNLDFQCAQSEPMNTIFINDWDIKRINATTDTADVSPGLLLKLTAGTAVNDMTPCTVLWGETAQQSDIYACDIEYYSPDFPTVWYHPPNTSFTHATYKKAADRPIKVVKLEVGMKLWLLMTINATAAATKGEILVPAANGFLARAGDPDGAAIDAVAHGFGVLATVASQNWVPVEYLGRVTYDKTA